MLVYTEILMHSLYYVCFTVSLHGSSYQPPQSNYEHCPLSFSHNLGSCNVSQMVLMYVYIIIYKYKEKFVILQAIGII